MSSKFPSSPPSAVFQHCPRCAKGRSGEIDAVRFVCGDCGFIYYYNVAVSAAVLISSGEDSALFIRRARDPGKDKLALPGGFVDRGETAEHAAIREVREEVGIKLEGVDFLGSFPNLYVYRGVEYPVLDLFFTATVTAPVGSSLEDVTEIVWTDPRTLLSADLAFPSHLQALAAFGRRFSIPPPPPSRTL